MTTLVVPKSALRVLEMTLHIVTIRANADGEIFGAQITEAMGEVGNQLGIDRLGVLLARTVLVRTMESLGENYPSEVLENYETRMRVSDMIKYLKEAMECASRHQNTSERTAV